MFTAPSSRFVLATAAVAFSAGALQAEPILRQLGNGWQVLIPDASTSDVVPNEGLSSETALFVEHFSAFNSLAPIDLVFSQIEPGGAAAMRLVIDDSFILNNTGATWVFFDLQIIGQTNGTAAFNQPLSGEYTVAPEFTVRTFAEPGIFARFSGGTGVPNLRTWTPGLAGGGLVIDIANTGPGPVSFTFRAVPGVVPAPAATGLVALAGLLGARRRRR